MSQFPRYLALLVIVFAGVSLADTAQGAPTHATHRVRIEGDGSVTVVFEAGLGDTLEVWSRVQPEVARDGVRTFAYNRAGYPGSTTSEEPRDAATIVSELREELRRQGLAPPYLLVGHSLGGLYMQYYARTFPQEVKGLVLVDSTHWDQLRQIHQEAPFMYGILRTVTQLMHGSMRREFADSELAGQQVAASPAPSVPTIVLSSSRAAPGETPAFRQLQRRLQDDIARDYKAVRHGFPLASGHYIQRDRPQDVIEAIRQLEQRQSSPPGTS
jgi:pimeloyl-ACP methyl ester carboxylesterase